MTLKSRIPQVARALESACNDAAQQAGQRVEAERNQRVPVDTGALRDSGNLERVSDGVYRYSEGGGDVDYAAYVEYGTYKMAAQPHFEPAVEIVRNEMPQIVVSEVKRAIS